MDLDVGSYNTDELMEALGVDTPRDQVTGVSLRECLDRKLEKIGGIDEGNLGGASSGNMVLFHDLRFCWR